MYFGYLGYTQYSGLPEILGNTRYFGLPDDFQYWVESRIKIMSGEDHLQDIASNGWCRPMGQWINTMLPAEITLLGWPPWSAACACGFACLLSVSCCCCCCCSCLFVDALVCLFVCYCWEYSPWVAVLVSSLCLWFCLFVLFVVVALVCLLLLRLQSFQFFLKKTLQNWHCAESLIYCSLFV